MKHLVVGIVFTIIGATVAVAHSGGTNGAGCHNETATGGYHCH